MVSKDTPDSSQSYPNEDELTEEETGTHMVKPLPISPLDNPQIIDVHTTTENETLALDENISEPITEELEKTEYPLSTPSFQEQTKGQVHSKDGPDPEAQWQTLHVASLLINLIPQAWRTLRVGWPLLLAIVFSTGNMVEASINFFLILFFFGTTLLRTLAHFLTLRFRIHDNQLEIKEGFIFRKFRSLSPSRIQNTSVVQNPLHKLVGLVELRIETAGSSSDGLISAISRDTANQLITQLQEIANQTSGQQEDKEEESEDRKPDFQMSFIEAILYGMSKRTAGTIAVLSLIGMELLSVLDPREAQEVTRALDWKATLGLFLIAFGGSWLWSAGRAFLSFGFYKLFANSEKLNSEEGLLTRRRVEVPRSKIQTLTISQPLLRRMMGYGTFYVETAALGMADGEVRPSELLIPMVEKEAFPKLTKQITPYLDIEIEKTKLNPAHPRAFYRAAIGNMVRAAMLSGVLIWYFRTTSFAWFPLILIPISALGAYLDWSRQGWIITPNTIITRWGYFSRTTILLARNKIQSVHLEQSPIMRWHGLGRLVVSVANSRIELPDIGIKHAHSIMEKLSDAFSENLRQQPLDGNNASDNAHEVSN